MTLAEQIEQERNKTRDEQLYVCALVAYGGICMSKPMTQQEATETQRFYAGVNGFCIIMPAGKTDEQYAKLFAADYKFVPAKEN